MLDYILLGIVTLANLLLGGFVLVSNSKRRVNQYLGIFAFALAAWNIVTFLEDAGVSHRVIRLLAFCDFSLSVALLLLFFLFCMELAATVARWPKRAIMIGALICAGLIITNHLYSVDFRPHRIYFAPAVGYSFFIAYFAASLLGGLFILARRYRQVKGIEKQQIRVVFLGLLITAVILAVTNVILPDLYNITPIVSRLGIYSTLILVGFSAYAIIKHRFLDIRLVVARSVTYVLLLTTLAVLYGISIFAVSELFFTGSQVSSGQQAAYVALAIILAFTFQPLRRFFEHLTDSIFYRDRYDSQVVLNSLSTQLAMELNLGHILHQSLQRICESLHIGFGQFIIFKDGRLYKIENYGALPDKLLIVPKMIKFGSGIVVADNLEGGERKEIMEDHGIRLTAGLRTHSELVGYLILGDKLSGNIYSNQDIELLQIATKELAVAISNARAYEEIQAFNATLQDKVTHATNRLQAANRHLKELDLAKDEFISMASHQLRTPLTTIKGYLSMMLDGDTGKVSAAQRHFIEYAFDGSERMVSLINDLLNVSRLSAGRFVIERAPTDMLKMVEEEVHQLTTHAQAKGLALSFTPPKYKLPLIELDGTKTRQVVMNFIDNAIYYTPSGSITVSLNYDGRQVQVTVTDTGIGVPVAARKHLFTKFYRADNAQHVRPDGTGLGLYLAKRVVEDQGGTIIFRTKEGQGSTFGFTLPVKVSRPIPKKARPKKQVRKEAHAH